MNLSHWFKMQDKKMQQLITLEQSILTGRYKAYGFFRLRYFNLQLLFHYFVHIILLGIVFRYFPHPHASYLVLILALSFIANSAWWGGLEVMRDDIRLFFQHRKRRKIGDIIGMWLFGSIFCSIFLMVIALSILIKKSTSIDMLYSIYSLSLLSILFSLAVQFPVKVYHSGIYAISRVPRTTLSVFISDIAFILTMIMAYPFFKWYSLPMALLLKNLIGQAVTLYFIRQVYQLRDIAINVPTLAFVKSFIASFPGRKFLKATLCMATFSLDHLIIAIWFFYAQNSGQQESGAFFILILPLLYASIDWAKLFYFDYKKDIRTEFSLFYRNFEKNIIKIAFYSGLFYWFLACFTHLIFMSLSSMTLCFWLLPVFVLRSKIAVLQIKRFAEGYYLLVIFCNLLFFGLMVVLYMAPLFWLIKALLLILFCLALILYLVYPKAPQTIKPSPFKKSLHIYSWLEELRIAVATDMIEIHIFEMPNNLKEKSIDILIKYLGLHFAKTQYQFCFYKKQILLLTDTLNAVDLNKLFLSSGGWICFYQNLKIDSIEMVKLKLIPLIERPISKQLIYNYSVEAIKAAFFNHFPQGICFDPDYQLGPKAAPLSSEIMQKIIWSTRKYLENMNHYNLAGYFLSVFYFSSKIKIIFLIPKRKFSKEHNEGCHPEVWQRNIDFINKTLIFNCNVIFPNY